MTLTNIDSFLSASLVGVCLFSANLLFARRSDWGVYLPLALLFTLQGLSTLIYLCVDAMEPGSDGSFWRNLGIAISTIMELGLPFLFWLYVRGLTFEGELGRIPRLYLHIAPIVIIGAMMMTVVFLPSEETLNALPEEHPMFMWLALVVLLVLLSDIAFKIMIAIYLILTIRRLRAYRKRLREVFSSTENRELTWIWVIMLSSGAFWLVSVAFSISIWILIASEKPVHQFSSLLASLVLLVLFWVLGIWGLRQRPGLANTPTLEPTEPPVSKYQKSALDDDRAARIARKIEAAMEDDLLYRDPNLSLWELAKHVGVTSHYVSQTLNIHIGSSFFDYVNRWRIQDAVKQLSTTDETILMIAYDVGFNSRSSFYKAFRRETGKTPSDMRK